MGRPMRPVNPEQGPLPEFAAGLRELRQQAGNLPFRQMTKIAHYSATTLSVACAGSALPSLEVTIAFVRACDGPVDHWRQRWHETAAAIGVVPAHSDSRLGAPAAPVPAAPLPARHGPDVPADGMAGGRADGGLARAGRGRPGRSGVSLRWVWQQAGVAVASAAIALGLAGLVGSHPSSAAPAGQPSATSDWHDGLPSTYVGISLCDPGSRPVLSKQLRLAHQVSFGGRRFPAGTVVGTVMLMYSPRCSEGWPHFSPASAFLNQPGELTLRSVSTPDNSVNTSPRYHAIRFADGEPMLTVVGCVAAEVTVSVGNHGPSMTAATGCFQLS